FFFQAEDSIRGFHVTGVQTCALPICVISLLGGTIFYFSLAKGGVLREIDLDPKLGRLQGRVLFDLFLKHLLLNSRRFRRSTENRSEERRVGTECTARR